DEIFDRPTLEELFAIEAGVHQNVASIALDQPHHHRDVELALGVGALHERIHRKIRDGGIADGINLVLRRLGLPDDRHQSNHCKKHYLSQPDLHATLLNSSKRKSSCAA